MKNLVQFIKESCLNNNYSVHESKLDNDPCFSFCEKLRLKECKRLGINPDDFDTQINDYSDEALLAICNSIQTFTFAYFNNGVGTVNKFNKQIDKDSEDFEFILDVIYANSDNTVILVFNKKQQIVVCFNDESIEVINKTNAYYGSYKPIKSFFKANIDVDNLTTYGDYVKILFDISDNKIKKLSSVLNDKDTKIYVLYRD